METTPSPMRTSSTVTAISKAVCELQTKLELVNKNGVNEHQRYSYAKLEDYINAIKVSLEEQRLFIITNISEVKRLKPREGRNSTQYPVQIRLTIRLCHESGEWFETDCYGEGQDTGDKAIYKAITGARKYGVACLLGLATTDDPENDEPKTGSNNNDNSANKSKAVNDSKNTAANSKVKMIMSKYKTKLKGALTLEALQAALKEGYGELAPTKDHNAALELKECFAKIKAEKFPNQDKENPNANLAAA